MCVSDEQGLFQEPPLQGGSQVVLEGCWRGSIFPWRGPGGVLGGVPAAEGGQMVEKILKKS